MSDIKDAKTRAIIAQHIVRLENGLDLEDFDPLEYITSDEAAAYITQALATNDAAIFAAAIGDIARAA